MREIALPSSSNVSIIHILELAGSQSTISEIIEYIHFGPWKYKSG